MKKLILVIVLWATAIAAITYDSGWITAVGVILAFWASNLENANK